VETDQPEAGRYGWPTEGLHRDRAAICGSNFTRLRKELRAMAKAAGKALTKSQIAATLSEQMEGISKKQAAQFMEVLADTAYKHAKNSFTLPGIGKLVLVNRKARMGRNPATGETIQIPAKKVVKFRVAKAAKDAILGAKK
jgi:DNA-binding protein HU-beta